MKSAFLFANSRVYIFENQLQSILNKFNPFWVYSQWNKLNLIIVSHRLAKL